ncbi:helicase [Geranomyces variabilis]|nr:helicase [Geranomyces variabilis]
MDPGSSQPPEKKRRTGPGAFRSPLLTPPVAVPKSAAKSTLPAGRATESPGASGSNSVRHCYGVVYRKKSQKKHKTWESDGVLVVLGKSGELHDSEGKSVARITLPDDAPMSTGVPLFMGNYEAEISTILTWAEYSSGRTSLAAIEVEDVGPALRVLSTSTDCFAAPGKKEILPTQFKAHTKFRAPLTPSAVPANVKSSAPRHNPLARNALVMPRPVNAAKGGSAARGNGVIKDVVVDPFISTHLRPHQRAGVRFLYECVCELRDHNGAGAILADEMGLGKTIQVIALIWTLLKQSPYENVPPPVKRALVICPASLVDNWKNEFKKWLTDSRIQVRKDSDILDFSLGRVYHVLVVGYEKLRISLDAIKKCNPDIMICDEGHRLKNAQMQVSKAISALPVKRRIILTGTPLQNDLGEFYAMVDLVNPGILGSPAVFKRVYETAIFRSRDPDCSALDYELGQQRSAQLAAVTESFVLRRTNDINSKYLPTKHELVVFVRPTEIQAEMYAQLVGSAEALKLVGGGDAGGVLGFVTKLKKLVNSALLVSDNSELDATKLPADPHFRQSGKLLVLASLLKTIKETTQVVIVSNWTQSLDMISSLCRERQYEMLRLDGKTPVQKRSGIVDQFNASRKHFVLLLSSKAGGVGLNLVGASRLVLFDIDWNPSVCQQAMARVWRDGQKREVRIYRFICTGTIEEKIYQRQLTKVGLSDALIDKRDMNKNEFSASDLKDIFTLNLDTECATHDLLGCKCEKPDSSLALQTDGAGEEDDKWQQLKQWTHMSPSAAMREAAVIEYWNSGGEETEQENKWAVLNRADPAMAAMIKDKPRGSAAQAISFLFVKTQQSDEVQ